jgi:hypothetical protein
MKKKKKKKENETDTCDAKSRGSLPFVPQSTLIRYRRDALATN